MFVGCSNISHLVSPKPGMTYSSCNNWYDLSRGPTTTQKNNTSHICLQTEGKINVGLLLLVLVVALQQVVDSSELHEVSHHFYTSGLLAKAISVPVSAAIWPKMLFKCLLNGDTVIMISGQSMGRATGEKCTFVGVTGRCLITDNLVTISCCIDSPCLNIP